MPIPQFAMPPIPQLASADDLLKAAYLRNANTASGTPGVSNIDSLLARWATGPTLTKIASGELNLPEALKQVGVGQESNLLAALKPQQELQQAYESQPWDVLEKRAKAAKLVSELPGGVLGEANLSEQRARTKEYEERTKGQQYDDYFKYQQGIRLKAEADDQKFKNTTEEEIEKHRPYITAIQAQFANKVGTGLSEEQAYSDLYTEISSMDPKDPARAVALNALAYSGIGTSIVERAGKSGGKSSQETGPLNVENILGKRPQQPSESLSTPTEAKSTKPVEITPSGQVGGWDYIQGLPESIKQPINQFISPSTQQTVADVGKAGLNAYGSFLNNELYHPPKEPFNPLQRLAYNIGRAVRGDTTTEYGENKGVSPITSNNEEKSTTNIQKDLTAPKKPTQKAADAQTNQAWKDYYQADQEYTTRAIEIQKNPERFKKGIQFHVSRDGPTGREVWIRGKPLEHSFDETIDVLMSDNKLYRDLGLAGIPRSWPNALTLGLLGQEATKPISKVSEKDMDPQSKEIVNLTRKLLNKTAFQTDVLGELNALVNMQREKIGNTNTDINREDFISTLNALVEARMATSSGRPAPTPQLLQ